MISAGVVTDQLALLQFQRPWELRARDRGRTCSGTTLAVMVSPSCTIYAIHGCVRLIYFTNCRMCALYFEEQDLNSLSENTLNSILFLYVYRAADTTCGHCFATYSILTVHTVPAVCLRCKTSQKKFRSGIEKSDILRYLLLYHYGGVYADLDVECLRPFEPLLRRHSGKSSFGCVFGAEPHGHAQNQVRPHAMYSLDSFELTDLCATVQLRRAGKPKSLDLQCDHAVTASSPVLARSSDQATATGSRWTT